ncbi:rhodanese-like domain-containing protein [Thiolapillus sp.]
MHRLLFLLLFLLPFSAVSAVTNIDNAELEKLISKGVPVIDIRRAEEWRQTGVVEGSHLITFFDKRGNYNVRAWLEKLAPIAGKDQPFILICRTGNRTGTVGNFLDRKLGYTKVYNVQRGIVDWIAKGKPVVKPGNRAPSSE